MDSGFRSVGKGVGNYRIASFKRFNDGDTIEHNEMRHRRRIIHGRPKGGVASPVVPGDCEAIKSKMLHKGEAVPRLCAFGRAGVVVRIAGDGRPPETAKIWTHDRVVVGKYGRDPVPSDVRSWMTVQEQ